jgi:methionyl-tRNA formyltransferase
MMRGHGIEVIRVVVADGEDRLAAAARAAGIEVVVQANPKLIVASEIAPAPISSSPRTATPW